MIKSLNDQLFPHHPSDLLRSIDRSERLFIRTERGDEFQRLLPWTALHAMLTVDALITGVVRAVRKGRDIPIEMLTRLDRKGRRLVLQAENLQELCEAGLSLVVNAICELDSRVGALSTLIERHVRARVFTNCYISFSRDSAFRAHWDDHDVLILQIHGRKRWFCYGQDTSASVGAERFPTEGRSFADRSALGEPEWVQVLEPGDVLLVPRGEIHMAEVVGDQSVHLTIGMMSQRGTDFIRWLADQGAAHELLRRDIPLLAENGKLREHESHLRAAFHALVDGMDMARFLREADQARPPARPLNLGLTNPVAAGCWLHAAVRRTGTLPEAGPCLYEAGNFRTELTAAEVAVLRVLTDQGAHRAGDLPALIRSVPATDVAAAVEGLARKSLIFVLEESAS